jgi:hypothetical protein
LTPPFLLERRRTSRASVRTGDLLSQWRGYGSFGSGYAIGIKQELLTKGSTSDAGRLFFPAYELVSVEYDEALQRAILKAALRGFMTAVDSVLRSNSRLDLKVARPLAGLISTTALEILLKLLTFKSSFFHEEKEWRMVTLVSPKSTAIRFRQQNGMFVPYVELHLMPASRSSRNAILPIEELVVGPSPNHELVVASTSQYLESAGWSPRWTAIRVSKAPFRASL